MAIGKEEMQYKYETFLVIEVGNEEKINAIIEKFKTIISENATLESVDVWGKKKLAYPIDFKTEGYYVLINFTSNPTFPKELERVYRITDGLLRTLVVRREEKVNPPPTPRKPRGMKVADKAEAPAKVETPAEPVVEPVKVEVPVESVVEPEVAPVEEVVEEAVEPVTEPVEAKEEADESAE